MCSVSSWRRAGSSASSVAPFMPDAAPRILAQLGHDYPYAPDGNGGPQLAGLAAWGAVGDQAGRVETAAPIFPRQEADPV